MSSVLTINVQIYDQGGSESRWIDAVTCNVRMWEEGTRGQVTCVDVTVADLINQMADPFMQIISEQDGLQVELTNYRIVSLIVDEGATAATVRIDCENLFDWPDQPDVRLAEAVIYRNTRNGLRRVRTMHTGEMRQIRPTNILDDQGVQITVGQVVHNINSTDATTELEQSATDSDPNLRVALVNAAEVARVTSDNQERVIAP